MNHQSVTKKEATNPTMPPSIARPHPERNCVTASLVRGSIYQANSSSTGRKPTYCVPEAGST